MTEVETLAERKVRYESWADGARKVGFAVHVDEFGRGTVMSSTLEPVGRLLDELARLRAITSVREGAIADEAICSGESASFWPGWKADESTQSQGFRVQGSNGVEWQGIGWRGEHGEDLTSCETITEAEKRLEELQETLVSPEVIRIGGHGWKALRIVQTASASAIRVVKTVDEVPNPGLEIAMARRQRA